MSDNLPFERMFDELRLSVLLVERTSGRWPLPRIVYANRRFSMLTGLAMDELLGRSIRCLRAAGQGRDRFGKLLAAIAAGDPSTGQFAVRSRGGIDIDVLVTIRFLAKHALLILDDDRPVPGERDSARPMETLLMSGLTGHHFYVQNFRTDGSLRFIDIDPAIFRKLLDDDGGVDLQDEFYRQILTDDLLTMKTRHAALLAGEPVDVTYRVRAHDGSIVTLRDRARPMIEPTSNIERVIGALAVQPAQDQPTVPKALEVNMAQVIAKTLHRMVLLINAEGRLLWASQEPSTGYADRLRAGVGVHLETLFPVEQADSWLDAIDRTLETRERMVFRSVWLTRDEVPHLDVTMIRLSEMGVMAIVGASQLELGPRSESRPATVDGYRRAVLDFDRIEAVLGCGYAIVNSDGLIEEASAAATQALGWNPADPSDPGPLPASMIGWLGLSSPAPATSPDTAGHVPSGLAEAPVTPFRAAGSFEHDGRCWHHIGSALEAGRLNHILAVEPYSGVLHNSSPQEFGDCLDGMLEQVLEGLVLVSPDGTIAWVNQSCASMLRHSKAGLTGRNLCTIFARGDEQLPWISQLLGGKIPAQADLLDLAIRTRDGFDVPVEVAASHHGNGQQRMVSLSIRDQTAERQTEETFKSLAYHDPITGLANRLLFYDRLQQVIDQHDGGSALSAVMLVDLDRFKVINDSLGLERGDQLLKAVSERLQAELGDRNMLARLGGDEFLVIMEDMAGTDEINQRAARLIDCLAPPIEIVGHEFSISASIGISVFPIDGTDVETLMKNADIALSRAKESLRGAYQFYTTDMNKAAFERLMLESRLRKALEQGELVVYYQPQVSLKTGAVTGVEALVRWFHPEHGMISPGEFIPVAEETGLIVPVGAWVLEQALKDLRSWHDDGFGDIRLAVNISARQFGQADLIDQVSVLLERYAVGPDRLTLELTESVIMRDADETIIRLLELRELGVGLSVDDFGTGYSSLGYLRRFPIETLKIDRSFIRDIDLVDNGDAIPRAIIAMSASLGLKVIAEGVETEEQLNALRDYGCDEMQGFLFSRPVPADQLHLLLTEGRRIKIDGVVD